MSVALKAVLNALALEADRVRNAAVGGTLRAVPVNIEPQIVEATPTTRGVVTARSIVADPEGLGRATSWSATGGGLDFTPDAPPRWRQSGRVSASGGAASSVGVALTPELLTEHFWYAIVRTTHLAGTRVRLENVTTPAVVEDFVLNAGVGQGWTLARGGPVLLDPTKTYRLSFGTTGNASAGDTLQLTAVTVVADTDPGEPFSGDTPTSSESAFSWSAGRNASPSLRHGRTVDFLEDIERERSFNIVPVGLTWEQRRAYYLHRLQAYNRPYSSVLRDLLVLLIRVENPSADPSSVRIVENVENYSFRVEIGYAETGPLAQRLRQLIADLQPAHLALEELLWGTFQADLARADITPL